MHQNLVLAGAEGQTDKYLPMLVKLGRGEEAIEYGLRYLATLDEALMLAMSLREHGLPLDALRIAEHGQTLEGETRTLARWLRGLAVGLDQPEVALKAARAAELMRKYGKDLVSIPHWFDSTPAARSASFESPNCFNPTLVRFNALCLRR